MEKAEFAPMLKVQVLTENMVVYLLSLVVV